MQFPGARHGGWFAASLRRDEERPVNRPCTDPSDLDLAAVRSALAATARDPWRASLFMHRLDSVRGRLSALHAWLAGAPRRMRRAWARRWATTGSLAALILALVSGTAGANNITVGTGGCTLADAITAANTDTATGGCGAGGGPDTITFDNANGTYSYTSVLPDVTTPVTIQGNGNSTIQRTGGPAFSVLRVTGGGNLTLENATITGGSAAAGGGIYVRESTLTVVGATIDGNSAGNYGGGIRAYLSSVSLSNATISGNSTSGKGGGIYADNGSTLSLTAGSTISGNSANGYGGGIYVKNGSASLQDATISGNSAGTDGGGITVRYSTLTLQNATVGGNSAQDDGGGIQVGNGLVFGTEATISGNSAGGDGGGIYIRHFSLTLVNATISGNSAGDDGGGIFEYESVARLTHATVARNAAGNQGSGLRVLNSTLYLQNSIVADQAAGPDCAVVGTLISDGYNIESATSCGFTATGDQQNAAKLDLGPLALNPPGATRTHAIGPGSVALNRIPTGVNGCGLAFIFDQRGVARPQPVAGSCDVGAYEWVAAANPIPGAPTAAEVIGFGAAPDATGRVHIAWETASEVDVAGFRVERAASVAGPWTPVGGFVPARGSTAGGARYVVTDSPGVGRFAYRLEIVEASGLPHTSGAVETLVRALRAFLPVALGR